MPLLPLAAAALVLSLPARAADPGHACDFAKIDAHKSHNACPGICLPAESKRHDDPLCAAGVWHYLDKAGRLKEAAFADHRKRLEKFVGSVSGKASDAERRKALEEAVKEFEALDAAVKEADALAAQYEALASSLEGGKVEGAEAMKETLAKAIKKEGRPLSLYGVPEESEKGAPPPAEGGTLFDGLQKKLLAIMKVPMVERLTPYNTCVAVVGSTVLMAEEKAGYFGDQHASCLLADGELGEKDPCERWIFCVIDPAEGRRLVRAVNQARTRLNEWNELVLTSRKKDGSVPGPGEGCLPVKRHVPEGKKEPDADHVACFGASIKEHKGTAAGFLAAAASRPPPADAKRTGTALERYRGAFETKALEEIGAGIDARTDLSADAKKAAKDQARADLQVTTDGKTIVVTDRKSKKVLSETPVPEGLKEETVESQAAKDAKPVAKAILEGKDFGAKIEAAKKAVASPVNPEGVKLADALFGGGAVGLKSESGCGTKDKTTAEDYREKLGRKAREKSAARSAERTRYEKEYNDAVTKADEEFRKCAVFPKGDPAGEEGASILDAKLISQKQKDEHPTVKACKRARDKAVSDAETALAANLAKKEVGTEAMQAADDAAAEKRAGVATAVRLRVQVIKKVALLRKGWAADPDKAKPYAKGYEKEITASRIKGYFAAEWKIDGDKGKFSEAVGMNDLADPTDAEVKAVQPLYPQYEASLKACTDTYGVRIWDSGEENDDVEKCVGGLFGKYIDKLAAAAVSGEGEPTSPPAGGGGDDVPAKIKKCMDEGGKWKGGKCEK